MKTKLVYSSDIEVNNLFLGVVRPNGTLTISGRIIKIYDRKLFWFFKLKPKYEIYITNPKISNPLFDGEYSTNKILDIYEMRLRRKLLDKIQELKEMDNCNKGYYIVILDYVKGEVIKIKLSDKQIKELEKSSYEEEFISSLEKEYDFSINNCEWIILPNYKERVYE